MSKKEKKRKRKKPPAQKISRKRHPASPDRLCLPFPYPLCLSFACWVDRDHPFPSDTFDSHTEKELQKCPKYPEPRKRKNGYDPYPNKRLCSPTRFIPRNAAPVQFDPSSPDRVKRRAERQKRGQGIMRETRSLFKPPSCRRAGRRRRLRRRCSCPRCSSRRCRRSLRPPRRLVLSSRIWPRIL